MAKMTPDTHVGRISALETGLEAMSKDVRELAGVLRDQGQRTIQMYERTEQQISALAVKVSEAAAPRGTNWGVMISAASFAVLLWGAALTPMWLRIGDVSGAVMELRTDFKAHEKLELHPVGLRLMVQIEKALTDYKGETDAKLVKLDEKLQSEVTHAEQHLEEKRLQSIKDEENLQKEIEHLRQWQEEQMRDQMIELRTLRQQHSVEKTK